MDTPKVLEVKWLLVVWPLSVVAAVILVIVVWAYSGVPMSIRRLTTRTLLVEGPGKSMLTVTGELGSGSGIHASLTDERGGPVATLAVLASGDPSLTLQGVVPGSSVLVTFDRVTGRPVIKLAGVDEATGKPGPGLTVTLDEMGRALVTGLP